MKLTVATKLLKAEVAEASPFAKGAVGVSLCIRLKVEGNSLDIRARNTSGAYIGSLEVAGDEDGCVALSADKLSGILANIPDGEVLIKTDKNGKVSISQGRIKYELSSIDPDKYFDMKLPGEWKDLEEGFIASVSKVLYAASSDSTKPALCGVCVCHYEDKLDIVATDGRVLSIVSGTGEKTEGETRSILPSAFMSMIVKKNVCKVYSDEKVIWFTDGVRCYASSLIKNEYPAYRRVIPELEKYSRAVLDKKAFESALKRMAILVDKTNRVLFDIKGNSIHLQTGESANGKAEDYVDCEQEEDGGLETAFDYRYLLQPLAVARSENVELSYNKEGGPIVITGASDPDWKAIIMPMNRN